MIGLRLSAIAALVHGRVLGEDARVSGVFTDSRRPMPGALFIALKGPNFDGHAFVEPGLGAGGALVSRAVGSAVPQILVEDTTAALGRLAANWRAGYEGPVVGLTGSNGKTTVKEMIAAILGHMGPSFATRGNLNNHIGVPLSLLELSDAYRYAVIEMGANHHGEIAYLTSLARPTVALVNNAGAAHLEGFGSIQGVAWAKGEIYAGLREGGTAVINADDDYAPYWRQINHARRVLSFGASAPADVQVEALGDGRIGLRTPRGELELQLPLAGSHNALNAAAATACALAAGADLQAVRAGLEGLSPVAGRLQPRAGVGGMALIDDSYNANPGSLRAAMEVLAALPGRRWLVLGAMGELGADTEAAHRAAGEQARALGLDRVLSLGSDARAAAVAFGVADDAFDSAEALASRIRAAAAADLTVLVKGSRSAHMERVVEALLPDAGSDSDSGAEEATCS